MHLFERLGLVNLQDSHGVQGGGCLARSTVSFGRESGCQLKGLGRETRTVPPSGGVSWAQVHRDHSLHLGNARVPPGHSAIEGSEDGGGGRAASGRERGHPRTRQLLMHLREERHRGRARLWAAPRSEKPIIQPRGLGTGRSVDLQPDARGCPGKHGRQLWVRCGGGDNTRGGQPHRTFILRGREPIPRCCDRHPIYRWRTEWNAGRPVGQTSEITREPDGMFAAWGVRGPWGRARRRGSYSNPQIFQSASRRSSARSREISTGGGRGCQSFHKGKARSQRNHAHTPTTDAWVIHERSFCVSAAQTLKTTIVSVIRRQKTTATRRTRTDEKRRDRPWFALLEFALSVEVPRGIADERDSADRTVTPTGNKTKINGFVEISTLLIHSAPKQKSNEWMHLSPFYTRMHGEWLRYAKSTSQFHWRFLLVRDVRGFQVNPLCRHDITRSDRQMGNCV